MQVPEQRRMRAQKWKFGQVQPLSQLFLVPVKAHSLGDERPQQNSLE